MTTKNPDGDFYRPRPAKEASAQTSTAELRERLALTKAIRENLEYIKTESAGLDEPAEKIGSVAAALRLLREMEQERNPKEAA